MAAGVAAGPSQDRLAHSVSGAGVARGGQQQAATWAQRLGSTIPTRLNRNVLEIVLDKDEKGAFHVGEGDCLRVMKKIGLDTNPGVNVEAIQICPNGKGIINQFCNLCINSHQFGLINLEIPLETKDKVFEV